MSHYDVKSHHVVTSSYVMICQVMSCDVTLRYIMSRYIRLCHVMMARYIKLCQVTSPYVVMAHYVTLRHITSHYVTLHHIKSHYVTLHQVTLLYTVYLFLQTNPVIRQPQNCIKSSI